MTKLRHEKIIHIVNNRHVTVHDLERLAEIAGMDC